MYLRPFVLAIVATVAGMGAIAPLARAEAPPPALDPCLDHGAFNIQERDCILRHPPAWGDWFGPIGSITRHVVHRGDTLELGFDPGVPVFFDRPISCGIGGCIGHAILWRAEEGLARGLWMEHVRGCAGSDLECAFRAWPDYDLGDAAERWIVLYAQHYRGIFPQKGEAHAIYLAPRFYPVRLDPVDTRGRPVTPRPGTVAYAVRSGTSPTADACETGAWWVRYRRLLEVRAPDCVKLTLTTDPVTGTGYEGVLPVDTGDWSIVAAPAGDATAPLTIRPSPYRGTTVRPVGDDLRVPIVRERRPVPEVTLVSESDSLPVGGVQDVQVTVAAVDGEVGSISVAFDDPAVLSVRPTDRPIVGVAGTDAAAPGVFTLGTDDRRTFLVRVSGLAPGSAALIASVSGRDDVDEPVAAEGRGALEVVTQAAAAGLEPPVVEAAIAADAGGHLEGAVSGPPGGALTVTLWSSRAEVDGACSQRQAGPDTSALGSVEVPIGDDGTGAFVLDARLTEGWFTYGVAADGGRVSRIGECRVVDGPTPLLAISDAQVVEGTASDRSSTELVFMVTLSRPSDIPVRVLATTRDGTAAAGDDFRPLADREVELAPGETNVPLVVEVTPDAAQEDDETLEVVLSDPAGARFTVDGGGVQTAEATGTIMDDDASAVAKTPNVRGTWRWVYRVRHQGRVLESTYTITITAQDRATGDVRGRIVVDSYDPYPTYRGKVAGTVQGDRVSWRVTGTGAVDGPVEGTLVRRNGRLAIRQDQGDGKVTFVQVKR